ncbi:hypothetical protein Q4S30_07075 [Morganella morganii]
MRAFLLIVIFMFSAISITSIVITSAEYLIPSQENNKIIDTAPINSNGMAYKIEECSFSDGFFYVKGWMAIKGMPNEIVKINTIVKNGENTYIGKVGLFFRWDITGEINNIFNDNLPYGKTGFSSKVIINTTDNKDHSFFIYLDNGKTIKKIPIGCGNEI